MNMKELIEIQSKLKAPKGNEAKNSSGKTIYKYRSCEDILEAVKPLLKEQECALIMKDEVIPIANRIYVKATATLYNKDGQEFSASAFAREPDSLATMNQAQVTGAASSYARKYALNGLFAIDDTKDVDSMTGQQATGQPAPFQDGDSVPPAELFTAYAKPAIEQAQDKKELMRIWNDYPTLQTLPEFTNALTSRRKELGL